MRLANIVFPCEWVWVWVCIAVVFPIFLTTVSHLVKNSHTFQSSRITTFSYIMKDVFFPVRKSWHVALQKKKLFNKKIQHVSCEMVKSLERSGWDLENLKAESTPWPLCNVSYCKCCAKVVTSLFRLALHVKIIPIWNQNPSRSNFSYFYNIIKGSGFKDQKTSINY